MLPAPWPPIRALSFEPDAPPYLAKPPAVIPIDVGRQLFVDDFLVEESTLARELHKATCHPASPVVVPDRPWERTDRSARATKRPVNPTAMVFSDGVFYDPRESLFKMWYMAGYTMATCLATSEDGIVWTKPEFDVVPGTNVVSRAMRDSNTVWLDLEARDERYRYKMAHFEGGQSRLPMLLSSSADGIHWRRVGTTGLTGDRTTFFRNPFRGVWVFSLRDEDTTGHGRFRRYVESPRFERLQPWQDADPLVWQMADRLDPRRPEYAIQPQLYNLDCVAYESVLLGLFTIYRGEGSQREKPNDICVGFSRDGFHFSRSHEPFVGVSERRGAWNWGNIAVRRAAAASWSAEPVASLYVSARSGRRGTQEPGALAAPGCRHVAGAMVCVDARRCRIADRIVRPPARSGSAGRHLFVNYRGTTGSLRVEVLDAGGRVIAPFTAASCVPVRGNHVMHQVRWQARSSLQELAVRSSGSAFSSTRAGCTRSGSAGRLGDRAAATLERAARGSPRRETARRRAALRDDDPDDRRRAPQFIKAAAVSRALEGRHRQILLHTGQHYDDDMSGQFFRELGLPEPDRNLGVGSGPHGAQTGRMLTGSRRHSRRAARSRARTETNSTLAGAFVAEAAGAGRPRRGRPSIVQPHDAGGNQPPRRRSPGVLLFCPS